MTLPSRRHVAEARARAEALLVPIATTVLVAAAATLVFAATVDGLSFWDFTLDDAYISYRYSDHLASGFGPVWNVGADPVEGYTSFLWVVVTALGSSTGADAETWSKIVSLLAAIGLVLILALYGRDRLPLARIVAIAALALSPAFLVITTQGMETTLAALLATGAAVLLVETVRRPEPLRLAAYCVIALLTLLARPDLLPYIAVTTAGLAVALQRLPDRAALRRGAAAFAAAFVLPGAAYLTWRWAYYGHPLPNTFYVKRGSGLLDPLGVQYVREFVLGVALPYVLLAGGLFARGVVVRRRERRPLDSELIATGGIIVGTLVFLVVGVLFDPIQGYLWRFQMPVYPALLLAIVLLSPASDAAILRRGRLPALTAGAVAAALVVFPLHTLGEARLEISARWQYDREAVGRALYDLRGLHASMLVTESGALPYYSTWDATDLLGLNDEEIAQRGLTTAYLRRLSPDLVMFSAELPSDGSFEVLGYYRTLRELVRDGAYRFVVAYRKTDERLRPAGDLAHVYLVRSTSQDADQIAARLRTVAGAIQLRRSDVAPILRAFEIRA